MELAVVHVGGGRHDLVLLVHADLLHALLLHVSCDSLYDSLVTAYLHVGPETLSGLK